MSTSTLNYYDYDNFKKVEEPKRQSIYKEPIDNTLDNDTYKPIDSKADDSKADDSKADDTNKKSLFGNFKSFIGLDVKDKQPIQEVKQRGGYIKEDNGELYNVIKKNRELHNRIQVLEKELYLKNERF